MKGREVLPNDLHGNVGRPATATSEENIEKAREVFERSPQKSLRRAAQQVGISHTSLHRIVTRDLHLFPYKIQTHQPLSQQGITKRLEFANVFINMVDNNEIDPGTIWFSDEAHFHLDGYVNKQNWRVWGSENPHFSIQKSLHPQRVTVWCAVSKIGIIGPLFIDETVTATRYIECLRDNFIPFVQGMKLHNMWFMQDGARPHRTTDVFLFLEEHFNERVMALDYNKDCDKGLDWPPYSPGLNPCDFFLWGCVKDKVYLNNPKTISDLKNAIQNEIEKISTATLEAVIQNFVIRLRHVVTTDGSHIEHIVT